jgi:hypothetical protein
MTCALDAFDFLPYSRPTAEASVREEGSKIMSYLPSRGRFCNESRPSGRKIPILCV